MVLLEVTKRASCLTSGAWTCREQRNFPVTRRISSAKAQVPGAGQLVLQMDFSSSLANHGQADVPFCASCQETG